MNDVDGLDELLQGMDSAYLSTLTTKQKKSLVLQDTNRKSVIAL